jgi:hypothetical protein
MVTSALSTAHASRENAVTVPAQADVLGKGVWIFDLDFDQMDTKGRVLTIDGTKVKKKQYNQTRKHVVEGSSFSEMSESEALSVGLSASYGAFSGSVNTSLSTNSTHSSTKSFKQMSSVDNSYFYYYGDKTAEKLRGLTTAEFQQDAAKLNPYALMKKYGTHVLIDVTVGGGVELSATSELTENFSQKDFSLAVEASYEAVAGSVSGSVNYNKSTTKKNSNSTFKTALSINGGEPGAKAQYQVGMKKSAGNLGNLKAAWVTTINQYPFLFGPSSLNSGPAFIPVYQLIDDSGRRKAAHTAFRYLSAANPYVVMRKGNPSSKSNRPSTSLTAPNSGSGIKVLGGGTQNSGVGTFLTESRLYSSNIGWKSTSKDHDYSDNSSLTSYLITIPDPEDVWETTVVGKTANGGGTIEVSADVLEGYTLVGGGAKSRYSSAGRLLTMMKPKVADSGGETKAFVAKSKDHVYVDSGHVDVQAIGLRSKLTGVTIKQKVWVEEGGHNQKVTATVPAPYIMTGGGGEGRFTGSGLLAVENYPSSNNEWTFKAKDLKSPDGGKNYAYAIGICVEVNVPEFKQAFPGHKCQ